MARSLYLFVIAICLLSTSWALTLYPTFDVHVVSALSDNSQPLNVHCQSKDDDLGYRTLHNGVDLSGDGIDEMLEEFDVSGFLGTTRSWEGRERRFLAVPAPVLSSKTKGLRVEDEGSKVGEVCALRTR
ncbi:hypothetical protein RJ639_008325 [Escallonia herrerae]|uniref:S-protein homolog n=1 Tax=Escallonia herrerae TaxID=1293975 RepID=A0AA88VPI3_9ASTE|nr:hypothetical protein RJ639_008325 [Escallonia herrerae]